MNINPVVIAAVVGFASPALGVDYTREVKPILTARCTSCHGAIRQKAGLRLDTGAFVRKGGKGGLAVEPGEGAESLLIERVTTTDLAERMPPESEGTPLSAAEAATLRAWIDEGAKTPAEPTPDDPRRHWAFQPPTRPPVPQTSHPRRSLNPIDAFLAAAQDAKGLTPAATVGKDLWLRRVTLDLIGLPPTREQLLAFRKDDAAEADETVVDRLLADPRHGERWGRHWMDVWRYSDWYGLGAEARYSHPHIWHWRDWIVSSMNADKGYDRMVVEMLAGDELAPDDPETIRATGFLARNWDVFNRNAQLDKTVEHTSRAFLGLTIQCARCHDHKYDPVSQVEYYKLRAVFEPYHLRVERVPGEPDRAKAGVPRAFDDFIDRPTYLFFRGDETKPDKTRPLPPSTPAVLGGALTIVPVALSRTAASPDKRQFVVRESLALIEKDLARSRSAVDLARPTAESAEKALAAAVAADRKAEAELIAALGKPEEPKVLATASSAFEALARARSSALPLREDREVADASLAAAEAKRAAFLATLKAERLEDDGAKAKGLESWADAARSASNLARRASLLDADRARRVARRDLDRALRGFDGHPGAAGAKAVVEARRRFAGAEQQLTNSEAASKAPLTTDYPPRPLEFPRAKTTYRDTPPTTPYARVSTGRRLALARWITDRKNPVAARVAVNHVWTRHFGDPLVGSTDDFGLRTARPELLALLDWLSVEFIDSGWSLKHLHRLIVTSRAYRMRSTDTDTSASNARIDPDNRLFWRMNARRMEGEVVRDSVLFLSRRLDPKMGGADLPVASAEAGNRRTLYYRYASGETIPLVAAFDAPSVEECYRRHETVVPQQALALTNSGMVLTRAGEIASTIDDEVGTAIAARPAFIASSFERLLGRSATVAEASESLSGLDRLTAAFAAEKAPGVPETRARSALVHVLLNHHDFITIR